MSLLPIPLVLSPSFAQAHTTEGAFVLTLPTEFYITGGSIVVGISFVLAALIRSADVRIVESAVWNIGKRTTSFDGIISLAVLLLLIVLVITGLRGTQDPLANPLPLIVWTLFWSGGTVAHAVFGNLWSVLNPWHGFYDLLANVPRLRRWIERPPLRYPEALGYSPAILCLFAFAWFELIYIAPQNPEILAKTVTAYFFLTLLCMLLFGKDAWLRYGEPFSLFFRIVSWMSPLNGKPQDMDQAGNRTPAQPIYVTFPCFGLLHRHALPLSGGVFILLMLSSVSFDGLSITYWWLGHIGINPLEFPGRSAVVMPNSLGLFATLLALTGCYCMAVFLGNLLVGETKALKASLGLYVIAIVPIAFGYHFAHYLTIFMVDVQYLLIALNDPFERGWNLLGLSHAHVTTSFLTTYESVRFIWHGQVAVIVIAHVVAVLIAHVFALRQTNDRRRAVLSQLPMTVLMIGYTLFGLWLLSAPTVG